MGIPSSLLLANNIGKDKDKLNILTHTQLRQNLANRTGTLLKVSDKTALYFTNFSTKTYVMGTQKNLLMFSIQYTLKKFICSILNIWDLVARKPAFGVMRTTMVQTSLGSLISTFCIRLLDSIISRLATREIKSRPDLWVTLTETPKTCFPAPRPIYNIVRFITLNICFG